MADRMNSTQKPSGRTARAEDGLAAREQGVRTEHPVDLSSPQFTVTAERAGIEPERERQAADDANEAARNSQDDLDPASPGFLDERHRDSLPGDVDAAIPGTTPHRKQ
jgi:hypothetical protein